MSKLYWTSPTKVLFTYLKTSSNELGKNAADESCFLHESFLIAWFLRLLAARESRRRVPMPLKTRHQIGQDRRPGYSYEAAHPVSGCTPFFQMYFPILRKDHSRVTA